MFGSAGETSPTAVVARLSGSVDQLQTLQLTSLSDDDLLALLRDLETEKRRLAVADHLLAAEIDSRGTAREHGCKDTATLLSQLLRISPGEASDRVHAAADIGPRRGLTGEVLPPIFGRVAAAQAAGSISTAHARIVTDTVDALPAAVQAEHDETVETFLVEQAQNFDPKVLAKVAHRISDTLNPDGTEDTERDRARKRELRIARRPDGSAHVEGELTAICTQALLTVLDSLAKPKPETDGAKDPRTPGQRNHDALQDAMLMLLKTDLLPDCNGVAATILLTMTPEQFQTGLVTTGHGAHISAELALTLAGDARIMPVVLGKTRQITEYGSTHRIFTEGQRLAMIARDQGCSFPGCTAAPAWCQAHHVTDFSITRRTSVDDGTLLCGFHHREHPGLGWTCRMINGNPHWTAPAWIDPEQTPRRNQVHEPALT